MYICSYFSFTRFVLLLLRLVSLAVLLLDVNGNSNLFSSQPCNGIFFLLALQTTSGVVFYSPLAGFSLLAYEVT